MELKNGEAYNGKMEACDTWMNMHLREVICTAKDGEKFWRMKEVFIRGNTIKYIRVPEDTMGKALDWQARRAGVLSFVLHMCWQVWWLTQAFLNTTQTQGISSIQI